MDVSTVGRSRSVVGTAPAEGIEGDELATIVTDSDEHSSGASDRLIKADGPSLSYLKSFDGVRGFFSIGVVAYHAHLLPLHGGVLWVDWFFVGSGFLITTLILDEWNRSENIDLRGFYSRRILRLFPAMYVMVATFVVFMVLAQLFVPSVRETISGWWVDAVSTSLYSYNFAFAGLLATGLLGHAWSLAVEEQFYLVWPPILRRTLRKGTRRNDAHLIIGSIVLIALLFFVRIRFQYVIDWSSGGLGWKDKGDVQWQGVLYRIGATRPDMIIYGCLVAIVAKSIPRETPGWLLRTLSIVAPICWVIFFFTVIFGNRTVANIPGLELYGGGWYAISLLTLGPTTLDLYLRRNSWYSRAVCIRPFCYLGVRCYGIYVWHMLAIFPFVGAIGASTGSTRLLLAIAATCSGFLAGIVSYRYIERPFLVRKARRFGGLVQPGKNPESAQESDAARSPAAGS